MTFRSGWCGLQAQDWQHSRCRGASPAGTACVCDCHDQACELAEVLDVATLVDLEQRLAGLLSGPGVIRPALYRLRAAALEVLGEMQAGSS